MIGKAYENATKEEAIQSVIDERAEWDCKGAEAREELKATEEPKE